MSAPNIKKNPSVKVIRTRLPRTTKMPSKRTEVPTTQQRLSTIVMSENSASDSDDTVIHNELNKLPNTPPELTAFNQNDPSNNSFDSTGVTSEVADSVEDGELGDDEKSATSNSAPDSMSTDPSGESEGNELPNEQPIPSTQPPISNTNTQLVQEASSNTTSVDRQKNEIVRSQSKQVITQADLLIQIKETDRLRRVVDKEIKRRKRVLKQQVTNAKYPSPKIRPPITLNAGQPPINSSSLICNSAATTSSSQVAVPSKIVLTSLNPEIVKLAIDKVSKRRRLTNAYSMISEILVIKQLLAKGNPFRVIPQYAYDISRVPGIKLPHIQELLRQWELYFANIFYQIVQLEYSIEYSEIEKSINTMIEGGDMYADLLQFQSFIGKEEVSTSIFKSASSQPKNGSNLEGPMLKKSKNIIELGDVVVTEQVENSSMEATLSSSK